MTMNIFRFFTILFLELLTKNGQLVENEASQSEATLAAGQGYARGVVISLCTTTACGVV